MAQSLALVSFLPDAGHVFPLLRIAAAFSERGYDVVCYLPQECEKYLKGYNFRFVSLGPVFNASMKEGYSRTIRKLSRKSIFYSAFSNSIDLSDNYWEPLKSNVSKHIPLVKSHLAEQRPLFMLSDVHIFHWWYVKLSAGSEIPLVLHNTEGHRRCQNSYVKTYGVSNLPRQLQVPVEYLGMFSNRLFGLRRRIRRFRTCLEGDKELEEANERESTLAIATAKEDATLQPTYISTGCGYFEQKFLKSMLHICDGLQVFGPLRPKSVVQLSLELRKWLESSSAPVVYVSFGSMIHLDLGIVRAIIAGLTMLNVRVLWSMPKAQQNKFLSELDIPTAVRFEDFLPPLEVLTMPVVRCGINHGGAGSVQDCLLSGKPMLCIPFMWDQPFNSSVVSSLEIGKRLWKRQVSARTIARAVDSLLLDNRFALRAMNLATEPLYSSSESDVVEHVLNQPSISNRARKLLDREGISPDVGPVPR